MPMWLRKVVAVLAIPFSAGYSGCRRCGRSWLVAKTHCTPYTEGNGCFPMCELCWSEITPHERLPYYFDLVMQWRCQGCESHAEWAWPLIERAVLEGK